MRTNDELVKDLNEYVVPYTGDKRKDAYAKLSRKWKMSPRQLSARVAHCTMGTYDSKHRVNPSYFKSILNKVPAKAEQTPLTAEALAKGILSNLADALKEAAQKL